LPCLSVRVARPARPVLISILAVFYLLAYFSVAVHGGRRVGGPPRCARAQDDDPVMLIIMIPWILWMPISPIPNSLLRWCWTFVRR